MMKKRPLLISGFLMTFTASLAFAQGRITTPKEQFGFNIGDDYHLANYAQMTDYWQKLDRESDRMALVEIGKTCEGRTLWMAVLTSPENHRNLSRYKDISRRLALAEGLTDDEARALAAEGKAVVWIDSGLHVEPVGTQQLIELAYQMTSLDDPETLRILDEVILLVANVNPDGLDFYADWYMREPEPAKRTDGKFGIGAGLPKLYNQYIGHDNNRDFYMANMPESEAVCRILYREWIPQIMWDQHQTGPSGTVFFTAPFRSPFNYEFDPLVVMGVDLVGAAIHSRMIAEDKPGSVMRSEASYQTWWNGGGRTTPYFHNMIGILSEFIGNPTPSSYQNAIPFLPDELLPYNDHPYPIDPQPWRFRQSIDYSMTVARGILDLASRLRENFLFNIYLMGKRSIEKGSRDHWTVYPRRVAAVHAAMERDGAEMVGSDRARGAPLRYFDEVLHDPASRDARGYVIPKNQPDFLTATKFVNVLIKGGVLVERATRSFEINGKEYPEGSYVVRAAQAFRPHLRSLFEPQDYPDDLLYPGGPPKPPYDSAGWTLAYQMGVEFDSILDGFDGPFERLDGFADTPAGKVSETTATGFLLSHQVNDAVIAVNQLLASGEEVYWLKDSVPAGGKSHPAGTIYIPAKPSTVPKLQKLASEVGLNFEATDSKPRGEALRLRPVRIGLWDEYGGSITSGWIRWLFDQYGFDYEVVFPQNLDAGNLAQKLDVLVFPDGAVPEGDGASSQPDPEVVPAEWKNRLGAVTVGTTVPQLRQFLDDGGSIVAIGDSIHLGYHLGLPIQDQLVDETTGKPFPMETYWAPGSVHQVRVDNSSPLAYGLPENVDVYFDQSPVFRLKPGAETAAAKRVAWYSSEDPLRSGWAIGQHLQQGGLAVMEADVGKGKLLLFGPLITFRAQPHGTFKFLFNGIYYGSAEAVKF